MFKECSLCQIHKPLSAFHKQKGGRFGCHSKCKECRKDRVDTVEFIEDTGLLRCSLCEKHKVRSEFYMKSGTRRGFSSRCRDCMKEQKETRESQWIENDLDGYLKHLAKQEADPDITIDTLKDDLARQEFLCYFTGHTMTYKWNRNGNISAPMNIGIYRDKAGNVQLVCQYIRTIMSTFYLSEEETREFVKGL